MAFPTVTLDLEGDFMLAALDLPENHLWIHVQKMSKQIQVARFRSRILSDTLSGPKVGHHHAAGPLRNQDGAVQCVEQCMHDSRSDAGVTGRIGGWGLRHEFLQ